MSKLLRAHGILAVGLALSCIAIYYAVVDLDWRALVFALSGVDYIWLSLSAFYVTIGMALRGWRWSLFAGEAKASPFTFARAVNLGVLANQVLPGRVGELVRIYSLMRLLPTKISVAIASALFDRAADVAVLILSASFLVILLGQNIVPKGWLIYVIVVFVLMIFTFYFLRTSVFMRLVSAVSESKLNRWDIKIDVFIPIFNSMWRNLRRPSVCVRLFIAAITLLLIDYLTVSAVMSSVGLNLPIEVPLILWVALAASSALPSAPGYVGVYQLAAIWTLGVYNVAAHQAIAVAFVLQGTILMVSIVGAVSYFIKDN